MPYGLCFPTRDHMARELCARGLPAKMATYTYMSSRRQRGGTTVVDCCGDAADGECDQGGGGSRGTRWSLRQTHTYDRSHTRQRNGSKKKENIEQETECGLFSDFQNTDRTTSIRGSPELPFRRACFASSYLGSTSV